MSDTTSPSSGHLHPLSPSSSMSSTDSAPQSEPTSDEQPDLGAFTTVLRAWTYLQPPPRIPVQIYSPTTSATTTFQPDQSVVDSDLQSNSQALPSSSSFNRPPSGSVLHEDSTEGSHALQSFSSFTRPTSSSVLQEESTVWNHAPIASYLYSETPSIDLEDVNSVISTEGGRTVEINSEMSFDEHSSRAPSQTPCQDVIVPDPSLLLPESDSSAPISHLNLPSSDTVSYFSELSLLSYQIPESEDPDQRTVISTASLKLQRSTVSNSMTTPTFGSPSAIPALPVHDQQQHRTVIIHPPTQSISDDASVSHLSLPPTGPPLPQPQPKLGIGTSVSSFTRGVGGDGQGTIVVDDLRTPDQTPDSFLVDWKRGGKAGGFRPVDDDHEEERGDRKTRGYGLGFGFGRVPQGWGHDQKHVSGYTSNYEGSQSSFRARRSSEIRGRTRLEPQHEDDEDSDFNSYAADHQVDEDQNEEDEEGDGYPFPRYRRRSGEFHFQTHTPRYYGRRHTPPRGVLPTHPPRLGGQIRTQSSMEVLHGLAHSQAQAQAYKDSRQHSDLDSYPDPYPRPHARPHVQDKGRDINSSRSSHSSSLPSISSSPSRSQIEPSPIQRDYVLIQPQTQLLAPVLKQSFLQQTQMQMQSQTQSQQSQSQPQLQVQAQAQTSRSVSYLLTQNQGLSIHSSTTMTTTTTTTTALPPVPTSISSAPSVSLPASSSAMSIPPSFVPTSSLSNKHCLPPPPPPPPSSSPSSLNPDNPGEPMKRASWEYVDLEEDGDELVSVSVSEGSSVDGSPVVGVGVVGVVGGDSGLGVGSGTSFGHRFPMAQLPQSTKQLQPITKLPSLDQQHRRQLDLQYQQSDVQTRLHVEPDSDGSEEGGSTAAGGDASVLVSELITTAPTAPSIAISTTAIMDDFQSPSLNSIPRPIPRPIPPSIPSPSSSPIPESNTDSNPNLKFDACTNNHPKHTHTQSRFSNYSYPGFHSDSHVAHIEDTMESELDLDLDDDLDRDRDVKVSAVQRVGGAGSDALLPSLGYLDEALSFIAEERARWSAAREGSGAGTGESAVVDVMFAKGGRKKTENRKVLDHDVDTPKRKRRRKRRQSQPPHALSNSTPGLLEPPLPITQHTVDEDAGGPSTSTSSTKRKRIRSSSWSPTKKKNSKGKEKEFLIAPPVISAPSFLPPPVLIQGERDQSTAGVGVVFHSRSTELLSVKGHGSSKKDGDGDRTPTNSSGVTEDVSGPVDTGPTDLPRKRSKMGKKEKERERVRKDLMIGKSVDKEAVVEKAASRGPEVAYDENDDHESDKDENDEEDDAVSHDDLSVEDNSSLNNLSLLQPPQSRRDFGPRKKGKDIAHIHNRAGISGAYKSTPGSPKRLREFDDIHVDREGGGIYGHESLDDVDVEENEGSDGNDALDVVPDKESTDKKRALTKRRKGLVRVRSVPQLDAEGPTPYTVKETVTPDKPKSKKAKSPAVSDNGVAGVDLPNMAQPQTKRSRLIALAKELRQFFPEQRQELRRVTLRFEKQGMEPRGKGKKAFLTSDAFDVGGSALMPTKSAPMPVPGVRKSKRSIHRRSGSESTIVNPIEGGDAVDIDGMLEVEEEDDELDPRGRPPKKGNVLIHVFIDHSNILIGLLSHLKRFPLSLVTAESKRIKRSHPIPTISAKTTPTVSMSHVTTSALAFAAVKPTSTRPLPNPNLTTSGNGKVNANTSSSSSIPITVAGDYHHRIPLPSFATMSRSLPSGSVLNEYPIENDDGSQIEEKDVHSDAYQNEDVDDLEQTTSLVKAWKPDQKEKKSLKHLWHAALVLLLERGRSVTRRVVVTSSPLYQPMDEIERLGYELRVYVRVPDLGDGMDRDRRRDRSTSFSGGSKSVQSTPTNPVSYSELTAKKSKRQILGHVRRVSGSTSAESVSGGGSGSASSGTRNLHPYHGIANNTPPFGRIKYREQGVDELLQLKLHQALAATDDVPDGSTIVLATGDGNMGQFNEEGFLGPIRTALKRGWKVELYAWEDGLSRAWRREFGEGTEWGRMGMFRVIGMEQFAASLVEVIDL